MNTKKSVGRPKKSIQQTTKAVELPKIVCINCGCSAQSNFYHSPDRHKQFFKKIAYCKDCTQNIFQEYLKRYNDNYNLALYYTVRKIDLPYIHSAYTGAVENVNNPNAKIQGMENVFSAYMKNIALAEQNGWGTCFDESQGENQIEGLTAFDDIIKVKRHVNRTLSGSDDEYDNIEMDASELVQKWGRFDDDDLAYLESEYMDWEEQLNGISDKSVDIMVKQVCLQTNEIRKDRESGAPVEKKLAALRTLMKDSGLTDLSNNDAATQAVGMTIRDIEFHRPLNKADPDLEDVDNVRIMLDGFIGGTSRAIGKENEFTDRFDDVYSRYTIDIIDNLKHKMDT